MLNNSNKKTISLKQFQIVRVTVAIVLGMVVSSSVITNSYWLAVITVAIGVALILFVRSRLKEIIADERDYNNAGKAARYTLAAFSILGSAVVFVLMSLRTSSPAYEAMGSLLAYLVCGNLLLYSLIFGYLNRSVSKNRMIFLGVAGVVVAGLFIISGLRLFSGEDSWICRNGEWIKHGEPSANMPTEPCES